MYITIETRKSAKTGKLYSVVVLHKGDREIFLSFDKEHCAILTDGASYISDSPEIVDRYDLERS